MKLYTLGFTQKSAEQFFTIIKKNGIELLIDVRLNNQSQLAGFTKGSDLAFFLKEICSCNYIYEKEFAPTKDIMDNFKNKRILQDEYEKLYNSLIDERKMDVLFKEKYMNYNNVVLLCSEPDAEICHRRLLAEKISGQFKIEVIHL